MRWIIMLILAVAAWMFMNTYAAMPAVHGSAFAEVFSHRGMMGLAAFMCASMVGYIIADRY